MADVEEAAPPPTNTEPAEETAADNGDGGAPRAGRRGSFQILKDTIKDTAKATPLPNTKLVSYMRSVLCLCLPPACIIFLLAYTSVPFSRACVVVCARQYVAVLRRAHPFYLLPFFEVGCG